jgi:hypothetical protein
VNTPQWLIDSCHRLFQSRGYSVSVDFPYAGCLVPDRFAGNKQVPAIMLEINRNLYLKPFYREAYRLDDVPIKTANFDILRNDIWAVMLLLAQGAQSRVAPDEALEKVRDARRLIESPTPAKSVQISSSMILSKQRKMKLCTSE